MKTIVFDSGPIISVTVNNICWMFEKLKESYKGDFVIPISVRKELIDRPIESKRFRFEALQILGLIKKNVFKVHKQNDKVEKLTNKLLELVNSCYSSGNQDLSIIHYAEMEVVALALHLKSDAIVVDERMMRAVIEDPVSVKRRLSRQYGKKITLDKAKLKKFRDIVKGIKIIRSSELAMIAYEKGWLDKYLPKRKEVKHPKKTLLTAILWALKIRGCAISTFELDNMVELEM